MPEPCESRQVADEGGRWEWQCGNVNVKVTQKVTLLEKPFNLPTSTEYVVTGIAEIQQSLSVRVGKRRPLPERQALRAESKTIAEERRNKARAADRRTCQVPKARRDRGALRKWAAGPKEFSATGPDAGAERW